MPEVVGDLLMCTINAWALDTSAVGEDERDRLAEHPQHDIPAVAAWLSRKRAPPAPTPPEAGDAYDQLTDSIARARRAVDRPVDLSTYGPCGAELGDGTTCPETLYARPDGKP